MATTINAANLSIGFDIEKLKSGMNATRAEMNTLRNVLKSSIPAADEYARQIDIIERAYKAGAISAQQFERSLDHLQSKMRSVDGEGFFSGKLGSMLAMGVGGFLAQASVSSGMNAIEAMDAIGDKAEQLGVTYNELIIMRRTLEEAGGVDAGTVENAIGKMQVNLAKAKSEGGKLADSLDRMGLSAAILSKQSVVEAFKTIGMQLDKLGGQSEKMLFATELFGKAGIDMVPSLQKAAASMGGMEEHLRASNLLMNDNMVGQVGKMADDLARAKDEMQGIYNNTVITVAELLKLGNSELLKFGPGAGFDLGNDPQVKAFLAQEKAMQDAKKNEDNWFNKQEADIERVSRELDNVGDRIENLRRNMVYVDDEVVGFQKTMDDLAKTQLEDATKKVTALFDAIEIGIADGERAFKISEMNRLGAERDRVMGNKPGEWTSAVAPAIKAGTVEAYKFINKSNDEAKARAENAKRLDSIKEQLVKLNEKNFAVFARRR